LDLPVIPQPQLCPKPILHTSNEIHVLVQHGNDQWNAILTHNIKNVVMLAVRKKQFSSFLEEHARPDFSLSDFPKQRCKADSYRRACGTPHFLIV